MKIKWHPIKDVWKMDCLFIYCRSMCKKCYNMIHLREANNNHCMCIECGELCENRDLIILDLCATTSTLPTQN